MGIQILKKGLPAFVSIPFRSREYLDVNGYIDRLLNFIFYYVINNTATHKFPHSPRIQCTLIKDKSKFF